MHRLTIGTLWALGALLTACGRDAPLSLSTATGAATTIAPAKGDPSALLFAVIGDYGSAGPGEQAVGDLVKSWKPDFIVTTGDNNYPSGARETIDDNVGQYFHDFIKPYNGRYGVGARENRFFPSLGNHDWLTPGAEPYLDYFDLPGNERYYDFVRGHVHFFALDSDPREPDGFDESSKQAAWLKERLSKSTARWQVVYMHHPPYSSSTHGSTPEMQWPYRKWGVDLVLAGHDHVYERLSVDGLAYIVIGLGGRSSYLFNKSVAGSLARYNSMFGALRVEASERQLVSSFTTVDGTVVDELRLDGN